MTDVTSDDFNGLADKLETLDLTEAEQAILDAVLARAESADDAEVSGFSTFGEVVPTFDIGKVTLRPSALKLYSGVVARGGFLDYDDRGGGDGPPTPS